MAKTRIEWLNGGFSINPVKGLCPMACKDLKDKEYCYARRLYRRFKWNPEIRFDINAMLSPMLIQKPSRIFIGSTIELFGEWIDEEWLSSILYMVEKTPRHTFIFLTKCHENLHKWKFPPNAWVGASATNQAMATNAIHYLKDIKATVKFISFEPLLERINIPLEGIQWVLIGARTQPLRLPDKNWVYLITHTAENFGAKVFLKNNLQSLYPGIKLRQEWPK